MNLRDMIFVFGSNEGGYHGAGAALYAARYKGAILYQPVGRQGQAYAIPTKDSSVRITLPLEKIQSHVNDFIEYAKNNSELQFQVTRIGCGLAGLNDEDIAPMFKDAPSNCAFDTQWVTWLPKDKFFWGTF